MENHDMGANKSPESAQEKKNEQYKAPYYEFSSEELVANLQGIFHRIVPSEFDVGDEDRAGGIRVRRFNLPTDPEERKKRIDEIQTNGTDRTETTVDSKFQSTYERVAQKYGLNPNDIFDADSPVLLYRNPQWLTHNQNGENATDHYMNSNGILIYDAVTEKGIRNLEGPERTFKDLDRRNEALLAIVYIK